MMVFTNVNVSKYPNNSNLVIPIQVGAPIVANITFVNAGRSPALNVEKYFHIIFGQDRIKDVKPDVRAGEGEGVDMSTGIPGIVAAETLKTPTTIDQFFVDENNLGSWDRADAYKCPWLAICRAEEIGKKGRWTIP
jgi:hypothetical protein